jgi:cell division protein FtsI (penicillin-binding protein 3)
MGFVPADKPRLAMIVLIDEPEVDYATGGLIAAPVFGEVAKYALTTMGVIPVGMSDSEFQTLAQNSRQVFDSANNAVKPGPGPGRIPDFSGMALREALTLAYQLKQKAVIEGTGWVVGQDPAPGNQLIGNLVLRLSRER